MRILGIESSCDETAAAVVCSGKNILSHVCASSADVHAKYGGVFPELACRRHLDAILPVIHTALEKANLHPRDIDAIAVAKGPGLMGALLIGLHAAKGLAIAWNKPLIGVNHVEAHLYAAMMQKKPPLPALGCVVSGGHTALFHILSIGEYALLGTTVDDALGEAFDKVASLLGIPYPGGAQLEQLALQGDPYSVPFSTPQVKTDPSAFSFSGLKTAVLYAKQKNIYSRADIAASFQKTAIQHLLDKAALALKKVPCRSMVFGGGVSNNYYLRKQFKDTHPCLPLFWPPDGLSTDNAVMIAGLAYPQFLRRGEDGLSLEAVSRDLSWAVAP